MAASLATWVLLQGMRHLRMQNIKVSSATWLIGLTMLASGCNTFNTEWQKAARSPVTTSLAGRWEGTWTSDVNGHNGRLRCVITELNQGIYQARFHAKYQKVLSFGYTVPLKVVPTESGVNFNG